MSAELVTVDQAEQMKDIAGRKGKGQNFTAIAREMGLTRAEVVTLYEQWQTIATSDPVVRQMGRDSIAEMNEFYNHILLELGEVLEEAKLIDGHEGLKIRNATLKNQAEISAKRVDFWQRAGLIEDAAMAEQILAMEEKAEAIKELLKKVASQFPETREMITSGLTIIFDQVTGVPVSGVGG